MTNRIENAFGSLLASSTSDAWSGGVAQLDEWSLSEWARSDGYRRAARMLALEARRENPLISDRLVFPIVFLFRHAIELKLKECIADGTAYLGNQETEHGHDLVVLWERFEDVKADCGVGAGIGWQHTEWVVRHLQAVDNSSGTAWRYAFARDGETRLLPDDLRLIDTGYLSDHLDRALEALDGWQSGLDVRRMGRIESPEQ